MVKMVHNNYNTTLGKRSKTNSKTSTKTIGANFRLGHIILDFSRSSADSDIK